MSRRRTVILEAAARAVAQRGIRGLRVEELAEDAGVSTSLIYYHFQDRAGLLTHTLEFISTRAEQYTEPATDPETDPRGHLEEMLLLELQDTPVVIENSTAWGELRATAVFQPELREHLRIATARWTDYAADLIDRAQRHGSVPPGTSAEDAADRLTALVEGLSKRWLSGTLPLDRARELLRGALTAELGPRP
ncbi:TetR/AcrR family transcriptional regulator [Streptomyces sp. HU2014]|uniref:TetR/AcrR family transcriptional regulator n=1 Tax=Streptomyces sp. HU2014 TaxID=2939414 RepID=UPI00200D0609|nr:TetR/AcrR family transcriptional regulator [Streptomyces sp. HU2014]UQI46027.1 TetR/AcrR family transcriptional regulator [Streptomyces sp. HU2014]